MARIRSVKPEFFTDEDAASLPPLTRLAFIGLWTQADRAGRLEDRPARLKVTILPYDKIDFGMILGELEKAGFIIRYCAQGRRLIQIRSFEKHQRPHHTEAESSLPPLEHGELTVAAPLTNGTSTPGEGKGMEKGKEHGGGEGGPRGLVAIYNETVTKLSKVQTLSAGRQAHVAARLKARPDLEWWRSVFRAAEAQPFYCGENDRGWVADFDFFVKNDEAAERVLAQHAARERVTATKSEPAAMTPHDRAVLQEVLTAGKRR